MGLLDQVGRLKMVRRKWILLTILFILILPSITTQQANAEAVSIAVSPDSVRMKMNLALQENLTALPQINAHVSPANSTDTIVTYLQPIRNAIQRMITGAEISIFDIRITTTNNTKTWFLKENYSLTITGVNSNSGSRVTSRLSFVSMNVSQSLQIGGLEFNEVGPTILLPALQTKAAAYSNLQYYIDGSNPRNAVIPEATTARFSILDFTWVAPVSTWNSNDDILGQSTTYRVDPSAPHYNLTLGVPTPEGPLLASYTAIYSPSMAITVPANAWVDGNTLYFDTPTTIETVMPLIAAASLIIAILTFVADRRIAKPFRAKRKR
jgi:hypothetical protein